MAGTVNFQDIVKNLVHGTIKQNLCLICLLPLNEFCENVFTKICRENEEFSVAQVLSTVCQIQIPESDNYNVCSDCFIMAYDAYKFFTLAKRSCGILNYYIEELETNIYSIESIEDMKHESICITLPEIALNSYIEFDVNNYLQRTRHKFALEEEPVEELDSKVQLSKDLKLDNKVIVVVENGKPVYYKFTGDTSSLDKDAKVDKKAVRKNTRKEKPLKIKMEKVRKQREPMEIKKCSQCPVQYRHLLKMKIHMKMEHNIDMYVCKICREVTENLDEYNTHKSSHVDILQCNICETVFKKQESLVAHMRLHEEQGQSNGVHMCELCGSTLPSEERLKKHYDRKHIKKYTCYYCGRMYQNGTAFDVHVKKHEMLEKNGKRNKDAEPSKGKSYVTKQRCICSTCGRDFVDERALTWHSRLHTNERPYHCQVCGKSFVSLNRRNQHALCAHTAPTKRCPICPALFHLRSMVNTHIKKVHLHSHKRRTRNSKHRNASWASKPVPIEELSVAIQADLRNLQDGLQDSQVVQQNIKVEQDLSTDQRNLRFYPRGLAANVGHDEINSDDDWGP